MSRRLAPQLCPILRRRRWAAWLRPSRRAGICGAGASATDIRRINHRMHNKLFVADNALAITGGRNIGDEYFTRDPKYNFIDLDVVAAGPVVPQLSASFDAFWNSKYAYPIASLAAPVSAEPK